MHKWHVYQEFSQASQAAADHMANLIAITLMEKGNCHIILPGGETPKRCLQLLAEKNLRWEKCHWYPGDERCYEKSHPERNDVMLQKNFWSYIGNTNVHIIPAELGAEQGASVYRTLLDATGKIDIAFLGMGEDGHTASLFPGNKALTDERSVVPVHDSPKPPAERVSLGIQTLVNARHRVVLANGSGKNEIINKIKSGEQLPINCIGDIHWFVDELAYAGCTEDTVKGA